jgi:hypothetical protein
LSGNNLFYLNGHITVSPLTFAGNQSYGIAQSITKIIFYWAVFAFYDFRQPDYTFAGSFDSAFRLATFLSKIRLGFVDFHYCGHLGWN